MLIGSRVRVASSRTTPSVRRRSSLASTGSASGRVDSPPTSRMSAPSSASWSPRATGSYAPPSENESGVAFTIPITSVRPSGSELRGSFHALPLAGDSTEAARRISSRAASRKGSGSSASARLPAASQICAMLPRARVPRVPRRRASPDWRSPSASTPSGISAAHPRRFVSGTSRPAAAQAWRESASVWSSSRRIGAHSTAHLGKGTRFNCQHQVQPVEPG